jgi:hypothetical protein
MTTELPPKETTARTVKTLDLGTPSQPTDWFRQTFLEGPYKDRWQRLKEQIIQVPNHESGRLLLVYLPEDGAFGIQLTERSGNAPRFKGGLAGSHSLTVQETSTIKFAPGATRPTSLYAAVHRELNTAQGIEPGTVVTVPSTKDMGSGNVPLLGVVSSTLHEGTAKPSGFVLWFNPDIDKVDIT